MYKRQQHYCENRITEIERLEPKYENYAYPGKELLEKGKKRLSALVQIQAPLELSLIHILAESWDWISD